MALPHSHWLFSREQLENTPSRRCGMDADRELACRQHAANTVQEMGQRLNVTQLTINTAIVYIHRFYMLHSFTKYNRNVLAPTALFLAAKVEEQPRKLEHVIKVCHACISPGEPPLDTKSDAYLQQAQELVTMETVLLQTLGFEITIEHPHTDVVKCTQLVRASKDLAQTSYFMATNSLHLTTFCLQYQPTVIACVCIHLACKWSNWAIPVSTDGKNWWEYVDPTVTLELLDELTHEFLQILEKTPSRLRKIRNWRATQTALRKAKMDVIHDSNQLNTSAAHNNILVDPVAANFTKTASSAFPASVALNSGSMPISASHNTEDLALLALPNASYTGASHQEWPQQTAQSKTDLVCSQKLENSATNFNINDIQIHSGIHFRPEKPEHVSRPPRPHGHVYAPPAAVTHKMSVDKFREKRKLDTSDVDVREPTVHMDQQKNSQVHTSGPKSMTPPIKIKAPLANTSEKKSGSLKQRMANPPIEQASNKDDFKMKIQVSSADMEASSAMSMRSSPTVNKEPKDKHTTRPHKNSQYCNVNNNNPSSNKLMDGPPTTILQSPVGVANDGGAPSSSSRKRPHSNDSSYSQPSKMSKSSKSTGTKTSSVKQCLTSPNNCKSHLLDPPSVLYQGRGQINTYVKLEQKPVEKAPPDYHDTFDLLDSLLSAQGINM